MSPKRSVALTAGILLATAVLATPAAEAADLPPGSGYTLAFADEFTGNAVDTSVWNYRTDRKALSAQLPDNVSEAGGLMTIALRKQQVGTYAYTGGGLVSKQAFRYGYYEVRAKTPAGAGWHTSFWAQAGNGTTTYNPERRTEIDQFEIDSGSPTKVSQGLILWNPDGSSTSGGRKITTEPFDTSAGWHTYGFDWNESQLRYYVDGTLNYTVDYPPSKHDHNYLNIWLTSIGYQTVDDSKLPATAQFDYVRYYQKDYYVDNDTAANYGYSETGAWQDSTLPGYTVGTTSRYSSAAGATATWRPDIRAAGTFDVYAYKIAHDGNDPGASFSVVHDGQTATVPVDYTTGATGWVKLGTWAFPAGTGGSVTLHRGSGFARADAVKFVRQ